MADGPSPVNPSPWPDQYWPRVDLARIGISYSLQLAFSAKVGLELSEHAEHVEEGFARRRARISQRQQVLKAGTISFDGSGIDCLVRKMPREGANLEVEAKSAFPTHSTWLSTQSTAITIVTLSGGASDRYRVQLGRLSWRPLSFRPPG